MLQADQADVAAVVVREDEVLEACNALLELLIDLMPLEICMPTPLSCVIHSLVQGLMELLNVQESTQRIDWHHHHRYWAGICSPSSAW